MPRLSSLKSDYVRLNGKRVYAKFTIVPVNCGLVQKG